jgi:outer membrane lipoprotein-sorting protein
MFSRFRWRATLALLGAFAAAAPTLVGAEDAPIDLHATVAKKPKPAKDAPKPAPPSMSAADAVANANTWLDDARVMTADFVQIGPDGSRSDGELHLARPGHMLFKYNPPQRLEIVADGRSVAVRDQKLGTQDEYFIGQTPLKFLLADHIDLAKDTKIKRVEVDDKAVTIDIVDKATFGGAAEIALVFDPLSFALKQWTVIDSQGFQTLVTLFDVDLVTKPDPALFHIDESVGPPGGGVLKR